MYHDSYIDFSVDGSATEDVCLSLCRANAACLFIQFYSTKNHCYLKSLATPGNTGSGNDVYIRFRYCVSGKATQMALVLT